MREGGLRVQGLFNKKSGDNMPLVSIITVAKNSERTIAKTIDSIVNQTYKNIEYIVVDGLSTDNTLECIEKYSGNVAYWISQADENLYDAMNKGIQSSSGDIIAIVNSDDWLELDAVESVVSFMIGTPGVELVHGNINVCGVEGTVEATLKPRLYAAAFYISLPYYHPTWFVKRSAYERIGLFDISFGIVADYDLFLRFKRRGAHMCYIDKTISNMRSGGISDRPANFWKTIKESLRAKAKNRYPVLPSWFGAAIHVVKYQVHLFLSLNNMTRLIGLYRVIKLFKWKD